MKFTKRTLALFIAVLMVATSLLSVSSFAAVQFPDVADNNPYRSAIYSLVGKGVINGIAQEDGSFLFKPDATITRAEFAKMIAVAITGNAALTETTTKFPDVAENHWANKYIAYAVKAGIINGRDDGTFRPENPVTYGEAVKMVVCAKGYGSLYKQNPGEAWYQGYIKVANDVNLTKNAVALGTAEAPRAMVAQLIYNMDYAKKVDTGNVGGGPDIDLGEDDDYEEESGAVTAVFENSLTGENYGLNKFQIMIDEVVYNLEGGLTVDDFYDYLGVMIDFEYYEDGDKKVITKVTEWGRNDVLVIRSEDIESISSDVIEYYKDENANKVSEAKLSDNLYVIYNGQGVPQSDITSSFIKEYFDIDCGEIRLENNDGSKDFEVAYVTDYETYFVTGRTISKDVYKFTDAYKSKSVELENDDSDYVVYKVTSAGGSKSNSTVSAIGSNKVVLSVAKPLSKGVTEAIVSTATLKNAEVTEMSGYGEVYIKEGSKEEKRYFISDYYMELMESDPSTYEFEVGDVATFYLDYSGRIVYMTMAESTEPYAYVLGFDSGSGLDGKKAIMLLAVSGSGSTKVTYPIKSSVKVNGSTMDASSLEAVLMANADVINEKLGNSVINGEYAQLVKFATANVDGEPHLSEIYTIDYENPSSGYIIPAPFNSGDGKEEFTSGGELTHNNKAFTYGGSNQFIINTSTVIFLVPSDRKDFDEYKRQTASYFKNTKKYVVEPYDVKNNVARAVLVYTGESTAEIVDGSTDAVFVCGISSAKNPDTGEIVNRISYIKAGDAATEANIKTAYTVDLDGIVTGINPGDIVKLAIANNEVENIQKVFVDGKLYDYEDDNCFATYPAVGNMIEHDYLTTSNYYRVILGTVDTVDIDGASIGVVPQIVDDNEDYVASNWKPFNNLSSTKLYVYDPDTREFSTDVDLGSLSGASNGDVVDAVSASKVLVIVKGGSVKAIYILDTDYEI